MADSGRRAYEELRVGVEARGGSMWHEKAGWPRGGVWIVRLDDTEGVFRSNGMGYPELDRLYVPKMSNREHWSDYTTTLVPGAIDKLVRKLD